MPSAVTNDVAASGMDLSDEEIKERMSGNSMPLRRLRGNLRRHPRSVRSGGDAMKNFTYSRARDCRGRDQPALAPGQLEIPGRRHEPGRPDARKHRAAGRADRCHAVCARSAGSPNFRTAGFRIGAAVRNSAVANHRADPGALSGAVAGHSVRRVRTDQKHGHRRRQSHAAHALLLLLRRSGALQ